MKKSITLLVFITIPFLHFDCFSQTVVSYQSVRVNVPDPVVTEKQFANFEYYMNLAREQFLLEDYDKTFYYLKTAEKDGIHSSSFWFYLGITVHHRGNVKASKRYLKRGFYKFGCWECKDVYEK